MKNIALFGGAFDPPTLGHLHVAEAVGALDGIDEVWVMPSFSHMYDKRMVEFKHRVNMCTMTFSGVATTVPDEQYVGGDGSAYDLMKYLVSKYPDCKFHNVIGMDNAESIDKWKNSDWLLDNLSFIVLPRGNYTPKQDWYTKSPHIFMENLEPMICSSSSVRRARSDLIICGDRRDSEGCDAADEILDTYISHSVYSYMWKHGFYTKGA
jgi:nicotinate-nucleotide adenylyltransferase